MFIPFLAVLVSLGQEEKTEHDHRCLDRNGLHNRLWSIFRASGRYSHAILKETKTLSST